MRSRREKIRNTRRKFKNFGHFRIIQITWFWIYYQSSGFRRRTKYNCPLLFHFRIRSSYEIILIMLTNQNSRWFFEHGIFSNQLYHVGAFLRCSLPRFNAVRRCWSTQPNGIRSFDGSRIDFKLISRNKNFIICPIFGFVRVFEIFRFVGQIRLKFT